MKWITRERPKIDRVACPWLIARFIDNDLQFVFVPAEQVIPSSTVEAVSKPVAEVVRLQKRRCILGEFSYEWGFETTSRQVHAAHRLARNLAEILVVKSVPYPHCLNKERHGRTT